MNIKLLKIIAASVLLTLFASTTYAQSRATYTTTIDQRGTTVPIPRHALVALCADRDGCEIRMGMYNWDGTGRTASESSLFYYNAQTGTWRAEKGGADGTAGNDVTEHVMQAWACYLTDGHYNNWTNLGDLDQGFSVLSWSQYVATCKVTLID